MTRRLPVIVRAAVWVVLVVWSTWQLRRALPGEREALAAAGASIRRGIVVPLGGDARTIVDIYSPAGSSAPGHAGPGRPAILAIHGGSWRGGSIAAFRSGPDDTIIRLASQGLVVVAIDYRLARPGAPSWPDVIAELRETIRWMRRQHIELGIDPDRIGVLGQSAGAHLAMLLATLGEQIGPDRVSSRVQAVVSFYGPSDIVRLIHARHLDHEPARLLLGVELKPFFRDDFDASPINHVTADDPPMLLFHGTDDAWVTPDHSTRMARALESAGVSHRLIVIPRARHGFGALVRFPVERDLLPDILAFLDNVWNPSH